MVKGYTKIELTDVKTGKVETIEKHNLVTNALNEWFKTVPFINAPHTENSAMLKGATDLLGGIMLFDGSIAEDANTIFPPASVGLTGCGVYGEANGGVPACRGTYNATESVIDTSNKTLKFVYDFTTTQANGTIGSVCLTSKMGGYTSCGSASADDVVTSYTFESYYTKTYRSSTTLGGQVPVGIYNGTVYSVKVDTDSNTITLYYGDAHYNSFSVFDKYNSFGKSVKSKVITPSTTASSYYYTYFDRDSAKIYVLCYASSKYIVTEITLADLSVKEYLIALSAFKTGFTTQTPLCVYSGYLYACCYNSDKVVTICKVQLSSPTNVTAIATKLSPDWFGYDTFKVIRNGIIYMANRNDYTSASSVKDYNKWVLALNTVKNTLYRTELYLDTLAIRRSCAWYDADNLLLHTNYSGVGTVILPFYIATINNLENTVEKTPDKTMKITYTITEE